MTGFVAGCGDAAGNPCALRPKNAGRKTSARILGNGKERVGFLFSAAITDAAQMLLMSHSRRGHALMRSTAYGVESTSFLDLRECLANVFCIALDVTSLRPLP
jgi:hypothetical protein